MILIGQFDSPFVRRVGIALRLYDLPFEHRPWSVFGDADRLRALNPLCRVPTLVLDDGFVLTDSHMMLDYLDSQQATPLIPRDQPARHRALQSMTLATGLAEKAVSLFYERRLHDVTSPVWIDRCQSQIGGALTALESERSRQTSPFWLGNQISHVDIAVTCALRFLTDAHPGLFPAPQTPHLSTLTARLESTPVFTEIAQTFLAPT